MEVNIITKEDGGIKKALKQIEKIKEQMKVIKKNSRPSFYDERYYTDAELSEKLRVSRITLQEWRSKGIIGYLNVGGKSLYRESEIEKLLPSFISYISKSCNYFAFFAN
ncbi:MAG: helix-turn-helix domain-containing protein [Dysgonomonas sp.]